MTFIPKFASPCDLAQNVPAHIAEFLEIDTKLRRRFREESISDLLVACILKLSLEDLVALIPNESRTGGDFDLIIATEDKRSAVQFRIQSKKLTPNKNNWYFGCYRELAHPQNSGKQSEALIRSSAHEKIPTIPLYAFYNQGSACDASGNMISGMELASARDVRELVKAMVKAKPKRIPNKRLEALQPLFFPLTKLLCEPFQHDSTPGTYRTPLPHVFKEVVAEAIDHRRRLHDDRRLAYSAPRLLPSGDLQHESVAGEQTDGPIVPHMIADAIDRRGDETVIRTKVQRPRLVLVASR